MYLYNLLKVRASKMISMSDRYINMYTLRNSKRNKEGHHTVLNIKHVQTAL